MRKVVLVVLGAFILMAGTARADLTIETRNSGEVQKLYLARQMFSGDTPEGRMVFRGDRKLLWAIDPLSKSYTELTEADVRALGARMSEARAQMQEALKEAPPEQRAMMEKMMAGRLPGLKPAVRTVAATEERQTINGFETRKYVVHRDTGETTEVWAADPSSLQIEPADLEVFRDFASFLEAMIPGIDSFKEWAKDYQNPGEHEVPGVPILTVERDADGKERWRSEVIRVERGPIPDERFEVPAGYTKDESPFKE